MPCRGRLELGGPPEARVFTRTGLGKFRQTYMAQSGEQPATDCYFLHGGPIQTSSHSRMHVPGRVDVFVLGDSLWPHKCQSEDPCPISSGSAAFPF